MAERVTRQLGEDKDLVHVPPLQFTLFPYEAPDEVILLWRSSIPLLDRLDEDGDFEECQRSLMPTLFPPHVVRSQYSSTLTWNLLCLILPFMACIQLFLLQAPADIPSTSGSVLADPMGPTDIILPSWPVPLYQAYGSLYETTITRRMISWEILFPRTLTL